MLRFVPNMNKMRLIQVVVLLCLTVAAHAQYQVYVSGAMSNVMKKGQLYGTISLDTIQQSHMYGLGPVEYLAGEITIADGKAYIFGNNNLSSSPYQILPGRIRFTGCAVSEPAIQYLSATRLTLYWSNSNSSGGMYSQTLFLKK